MERRSELLSQITEACGARALDLTPLSGGCVARVYRAGLKDGSSVVVKSSDCEGTLDVEGFMLRYLAEHSALPVPRVIHQAPQLLIMEAIDGESSFSGGCERDAAELLAALHAVRGARVGFERDTLIGSLHQPNPPTDSWIGFFAEHRLLYMARQAHVAGRLPERALARIEQFSRRLPELIEEPGYPALIHGDVWSGNVLARGERIRAFLDPAIYFAHPEIELAFITLFSTFGPAFFERYQELLPIRPGFFETRRHVYNLYPLLVHVRLFGGGYVAQVNATLDTLFAR
jgi:fructosamine-3-kinase